MTAMSFARSGGISPGDMEALRQLIARLVVDADKAMEVDHWQIGIRERRAFPPGHEAMIDCRRLYASSDGVQVVWLIRGGRLIDESGHPVNLREYDINALVRIRWALEEAIENNKFNTPTYRPPQPTPYPQPRRRGFWECLCDWLGV